MIFLLFFKNLYELLRITLSIQVFQFEMVVEEDFLVVKILFPLFYIQVYSFWIWLHMYTIMSYYELMEYFYVVTALCWQFIYICILMFIVMICFICLFLKKTWNSKCRLWQEKVDQFLSLEIGQRSWSQLLQLKVCLFLCSGIHPCCEIRFPLCSKSN